MAVVINSPVLSSPILRARGSVEGRGSGPALVKMLHQGNRGWATADEEEREGQWSGELALLKRRETTEILPRARLCGASHILCDLKHTATLGGRYYHGLHLQMSKQEPQRIK